MKLKNKVLTEDMEYFNGISYLPWDKLQNASILITGATGLIGYNIIHGLLYASERRNLNIQIIALVRHIEEAKKKFADICQTGARLILIKGDIENLPDIEQHIDYIIHGASPTASSYFIERPVETIITALTGTINILKLALDKKIQGFVYLSSMEVYGETKTEEVLSEKDVGYMNPLIVRNSYSESKRMCETIVASYASEYDVPAMSIRLAQTFGVGVERNDTRVFAEFARCAVEGKDIVLLTTGGSKRCYLYTMDAVSAIVTVMLKGEAGKAYNAGNRNTYCSVKEMAYMVATQLANPPIEVLFAENSEVSKKFSAPHFYNLNVDELERLGWKANKELLDMYRAMIEVWKDEG